MRKEEAKFETRFFSEAGTKEKNNDYFGYIQLDNYAIWVAADGYDEEAGADVAAKLAVSSAIEYFMLRPHFNPDVIKEIMEYANLKVKEKQEETEKYSLMHTSLLVVISNYNSFLYGNVGNTRLYHLRGGYVVSQSRDDTIAQLLVDENALDMNDMKYHRQRNDLLQAIGDFGKIKPNIIKNPVTLQENDMLCLTTIGFWENIDEREMEVEISRYPNKDSLLRSLEHKVMATTRESVENYTFVLVNIEKVASPEPIERDKKKYLIRIILISLGVLLIILMLIFWNINKRNNILKKADVYEEQANDDIAKKNFNNALEDFKLEKSELEKLKPKSRGVIGFFIGAKGKRAEADKRISVVDKKIEQTTKLQKAFQDIDEGNQLFNSGSYDEAAKEYQEAKYILEENTYKKDELNTDEILTTLNARIDSSSKLKEALAIEIAGNQALSAGNYNLAKENYKTASELYLINGRADYVANIERKIAEIDDRAKTDYSAAMLTENQADLLSPTDTNKSRESYYQARQMYQNLGDTAKTQEIDSKINELNARQMANLQTANNLVQEGLSQITANNPVEAITSLTKAKNIYQELGDSNNVNNANKFISQAQEFIKLESKKDEELKKKDAEMRQKDLEIKNIEVKNAEELKQQQIKEQKALAAKEAEIIARQREIEKEKERREKIAQDIENATNLEMQADQLFSLKRYTESIQKYNEAEKIFEALKVSGDFDDQTNKIEYLSKKIVKTEGYLYEEQGDTEFKNKNWKEAEKKFQMAKSNMEISDVTAEEKLRVDKKLKKATSKANKKWWQFWK